MLKLFFNRNSYIVKFLFFSSILLSVFLILWGPWKTWTGFTQFCFWLFLIQSFALYGVERYPWYPKNSPGPGITLQFQKALVPTAYIWPVFLILSLLYPHGLLFAFFNLLLFPINFANSTQIYFHLIDEDKSPPNPLSGKKPHP